MKYRKFGKTDFQASVLGFGAMRLPTVEGKVDETQATEMLYYAIENGVNYVDTAYIYHGGESEKWLGKALKESYRDKVKLATKLPCWDVHQPSDFDKFFNEQLGRLQTDHIDFYLFHSLNRDSWEKIKKIGGVEWAEKKQKQGLIGHFGFSFHDDNAAFEQIISDYDWTFCQIQHNYMDINNQAGVKGLKFAAERNVAIIIMEPLLGGRLVNSPPKIQRIWDIAPIKRESAEWAFQYLWNQKEISLVLSGMSTLDQVKDNIRYAERSQIGLLNAEELAIVDKVRNAYSETFIIPCTKCKYCMPCPQGVNIPRMFEVYNNGFMYDKIEAARGEYAWIGHAFKIGIQKTDERAAACIACLACEEKCPQNIRIARWMKYVDDVLSGKRDYVTNPD
jgi:predicted aldo/keto reductase-like oxidoreductase